MPNIKIKSFHNRVACMGLFLEDKKPGSKKLVPGEIVEVPDDHWVLHPPHSENVEVTLEEPTRPFNFGSATAVQAFVEDGVVPEKPKRRGRPPKKKEDGAEAVSVN